jgi:transposase
MAKTLSEDLRSRVIEAVESGALSCNAAAERFDAGIATAVRWVRAFRDTGATAPKPKGGDLRSHRIEFYRDVILAAIEAKADITLVEIADLLRDEHGADFAPSSVWRFLDRHCMTVKKNRARQRAETARRRRAATGLVHGST